MKSQEELQREFAGAPPELLEYASRLQQEVAQARARLTQQAQELTKQQQALIEQQQLLAEQKHLLTEQEHLLAEARAQIAELKRQTTTGLITMRATITNQRGEVVLEGEHVYLVRL